MIEGREKERENNRYGKRVYIIREQGYKEQAKGLKTSVEPNEL